MNIGGLIKFSLIDYPGKVAAVIFTQGCNFRCSYCHNPELVIPKYFQTPIAEEEILRFLEQRAQQLNGVVVTGGEPTVQKDLIIFLKKIKAMNYQVKLDTNGSRPEVLKKIFHLNLVDYVAMDLKTLPEKYGRLTGLKDCARCIRKSLRLILNSGLDHEFRTTVMKTVTPSSDFPAMVALIKGARKYRLQRFIPNKKMPDLRLAPDSPDIYSEEEFIALRDRWNIEDTSLLVDCMNKF